MNDRSSAGRRILLNRLYANYADDPAFATLRAGARAVVPGDGPTNPRLVFVGEAPGKTEDKLGKPFVGASGQFLNELLASVGMLRGEVFVTNAVKYRPVGSGGNRPPTDGELHASVPYLRREHAIVGKPPIVMLGKHARTATMKLDRRALKIPLGYDLVMGEWFWMGEYPMLPLYHPAYGLYQQSNKPLLFEQFKAVLTPPRSP